MALQNFPVGQSSWNIAIPPEKRTVLHRADAATKPPRDLIRDALEAPFEFEPMQRALTPDDRIAVVVDANLPHTGELLSGVFDHLGTAGIAPSAVTVITPPGSRSQWIDELPDEFADVTAETHDPADPKKLAYLATTQSDHRVYMNRTLVESDFIVVLSGRRFDPVRRYAGAEVALFPELAGEENIEANAGPYTKQSPWEGMEESREVAWLLGTPFFVQVIEGEGDAIHDVVAGLPSSSDEGRRRQDARWRFSIPDKAETVVATISGDPDRVTFYDLAKAAACAARCVKKGGRIALLTEAAPTLGEGAEMMRRLGDPKSPDSWLAREKPTDAAACRLWCRVARHASLFLASRYPEDVVEELFATPLTSTAEVQRLVDAGGRIVAIPDAHKAKVEVKG